MGPLPPFDTTPSPEIEHFLKQNEEKELLRFTTAGSVDDGKSTLIGRLLFDSKGAYEDQIASVRKVTAGDTAGPIDFALLTDGLRAEREQGITIDVAYRYFSTPRRKFIIADTPGHEQYTRNMATGASTANLAVILLDARKGVLPQTRRHAFIASLLGIPHMVIAINKMDLVGFSEEVFERIRAEFSEFAAELPVSDLQFIPISAILGDNVVEKSMHTPWYDGPTLLHHLETLHIASDRNLKELRFAVQYVIRPNLDFRGYAGQIASGILRKGDPVVVLPSGVTTRVKSIVTQDGEMPMAFAPLSITVCLEDEVDVSRGDMLVHPQYEPHVSRRLDARVVWMSERPLDPGREYVVKHTTRQVRARVLGIRYGMDIGSLEKIARTSLTLNEIGALVLETRRPLFFDAYGRNRITGSFILIDPISNETVAAGMITGREARTDPRPADDGHDGARVSAAEREARFGHASAAVWIGGSEEAAYFLERELFYRGCLVQVVEGERDIGMAADLARIGCHAGMITICAAPAGSAADAERTRQAVGADRFLYLDAAGMSSAREVAEQALGLLEERAIFPAGGK
jgi:sulfate adenylyltransferase large subunit